MSLSKEDFLKPTDFTQIVDNIEFKDEKIKNLTHCWIEGVNPWQEKYIKLDEFDKFIPIENLEYLKLSDCLQSENFSMELDLDMIVDESIKSKSVSPVKSEN